MKNLIGGLLALMLLLPLSLHALPYHYTSVRWIVATRNKLTYDDRYVTIVGHVTRRMGDEEYWFTDGTGSVRLDSENFDLPVGTRIAVGGRIDQAYLGFGHLEVDVRAWHYAPLRRPVALTHRAPVPVAKTSPVSTTITSAPTVKTEVSGPIVAAPSSRAPAATTTAPPLAPPAETGK